MKVWGKAVPNSKKCFVFFFPIFVLDRKFCYSRGSTVALTSRIRRTNCCDHSWIVAFIGKRQHLSSAGYLEVGAVHGELCLLWLRCGHGWACWWKLPAVFPAPSGPQGFVCKLLVAIVSSGKSLGWLVLVAELYEPPPSIICQTLSRDAQKFN